MNNLASAKIQKMKGAKHEKMKEALAIWIEQLNVKNGTATDEIINTFTAIVDLSRFNNSCLKSRQRGP